MSETKKRKQDTKTSVTDQKNKNKNKKKKKEIFTQLSKGLSNAYDDVTQNDSAGHLDGIPELIRLHEDHVWKIDESNKSIWYSDTETFQRTGGVCHQISMRPSQLGKGKQVTFVSKQVNMDDESLILTHIFNNDFQDESAKIIP